MYMCACVRERDAYTYMSMHDCMHVYVCMRVCVFERERESRIAASHDASDVVYFYICIHVYTCIYMSGCVCIYIFI